ncbi:MAG TPA: hypothetical protein VNH83_08680 [Bryobacteraceae bacterium]|nr:hypothetical protein [Bryobacteraceae bacterium]
MGVKRFDLVRDTERRDSWLEECYGGQYVKASDYDALAAELAQSKDLAEAQAASAEKGWNRVRELEAALEGISKLKGLTLLGGNGMESDRAYQLGANCAFNQAAEMAATALETNEVSK